jgi:cytochrome c oxidase subunit 2
MSELLNSFFRTLLFLPQQATEYARSIDVLHYVEMTSMVLLTGGVALTVLYFCRRYPRRAGHRTPRVTARLSYEIPVYGSILTFFLVLWLVGFRQYVDAEAAPSDAMDVYVTGKQWMWKYAYAETGVASVGVLHVPADRPVRLLLTSRDVIHSFFVPDLRVKRDAVPGLYTSLWFQVPQPGRHRVFCAELCGVGHAQMHGEIVVLPPAQFSAWLAAQRAATADTGPDVEGVRDGQPAGLAAQGRVVAARNGCLSCHRADPTDIGVRLLGPSWIGAYGSTIQLLSGETVVADVSYLTRSMMDPAAEIHAGYPPVMPSYRGILQPADVAALVEFIQWLGTPEAEGGLSLER